MEPQAFGLSLLRVVADRWRRLFGFRGAGVVTRRAPSRNTHRNEGRALLWVLRFVALLSALTFIGLAPAAVHASPVPKEAPSAVSLPQTAQWIQIISVTGAPPWGTARVVALTEPFAYADIEYWTPAGTKSEARGLHPKHAGANGVVSWTWVIGSNTRPGLGTVMVFSGDAVDAAPIRIGR
jgi:hypothetical protein